MKGQAVDHRVLNWSSEDIRTHVEDWPELAHLTEDDYDKLDYYMSCVMHDALNAYDDFIIEFINDKLREYLEYEKPVFLKDVKSELNG